jgi:FemAB-related protein (PEP-CTERM system-associated)
LRDESIAGQLPLFLVRSRIAGRMLVSVPYGVGGGILTDDREVAGALFAAARDLAEARDCAAIDLRSEFAMVDGLPVVSRYVGFARELPSQPEEVWNWLPRKARAAARNGRDRFRLSVAWGDEHLNQVWRLYSLNMRRLGSIAYPLRFFEALRSRTPGQHWVQLVWRGGRPVAGLLALQFRDRVMPYFLGATREARRCSAAHFSYVTLMERAVAHGYRVFDFGRSRRDNTGSHDFKRFCGFEPAPLGYQLWTAPGRPAVSLSPDSPKFRLARRIWPYLPLRVTQAMGGYLARHIPG